MVDFNDDGFEVVSEHDIEPQNVKTHIAFILLRLTILVLMPDGRQSTDNRLNDCVFNPRFECFDVDSIFGQFFISRRQGSFVTLVHLFIRSVEDIFGVVFVQRVVCEVDVATVEVLPCRLLVGFRGETG